MPLKYIPELTPKSNPSNAGIYAICEHPPSHAGPRNVKIGRSIDLRKRLNDYHICFPHGFHIYMLIKLAPATVELSKKQRIAITAFMEKKIFAILDDLNLVGPARHYHEYFVIKNAADLQEMRDAFSFVASKSQPYSVFPPIFSWRNGTAYDHFLIDGQPFDIS